MSGITYTTDCCGAQRKLEDTTTCISVDAFGREHGELSYYCRGECEEQPKEESS